MSDKRTFSPGRLLTSLFGIARGVITSGDWSDSTKSVTVGLQKWDSTNKVWVTSTEGGVTAYAGLPFTDTISNNSIVWMVYLYKTYFVILASC